MEWDIYCNCRMCSICPCTPKRFIEAINCQVYLVESILASRKLVRITEVQILLYVITKDTIWTSNAFQSKRDMEVKRLLYSGNERDVSHYFSESLEQLHFERSNLLTRQICKIGLSVVVILIHVWKNLEVPQKRSKKAHEILSWAVYSAA